MPEARSFPQGYKTLSAGSYPLPVLSPDSTSISAGSYPLPEARSLSRSAWEHRIITRSGLQTTMEFSTPLNGLADKGESISRTQMLFGWSLTKNHADDSAYQQNKTQHQQNEAMQWSGLGEDDGKSTFKQCLRFPPLQSSHRRRRRTRHQEHGPEGKWFFEPPCSSPDDRPPGQGTKVLWAFHPLTTRPSRVFTATRRKSGGFISNSTMYSHYLVFPLP